MEVQSTIEIGVDIGGTFTDVVCEQRGRPSRIIKIPTTSRDPSLAVAESLKIMLEQWGLRPEQITRFAHGTTIATNAVIERKGAKVGLITTSGFRDVLEIGRMIRESMYEVILEPATPIFLAPGVMRKEVSERIAATGEVVVPLDEAAVVAAAAELVAAGAKAIAVCFLFSFLNPDHEKRARALINEKHPDVMISVSHEVDPAFREYERTAVTAFDAYIKPIVDQYLGRIETHLARHGIKTPLQVMQSRGGLSAAAAARKRPVRLFLSGPAGGAIGGSVVAQSEGIYDLITVDVGGTSCDIAVINKGKPLIRAESVIEGYPVRVPTIDVHTLGAGGGSIAWIDAGGGFRVGPQSAGADPGPACYGRGGTEATVTDASIVLGYLNPEYFAGGSLTLYPDLAFKAVKERVANVLGLAVEEAALGMHRVLNTQMAEGIRLTTIRQGLDPRKFMLVPLGGAGPLHGTALARNLNITNVLVPRYPGVLSARGLLAAPIEHEFSMALPRALKDARLDEIRAGLADLDRRCAELMTLEGIRREDVLIQHYADVCHTGQSYHLEIPLHLTAPDPLGQLDEDFLAAHDRVYGYSTASPVSLVNLRTTHRSRHNSSAVDTAYQPNGKKPQKGVRPVRLAGEPKAVEVPIYDREALAAGAVIPGPGLIEQADTTTLLEPGWQCRVLASGSLLLSSL